MHLNCRYQLLMNRTYDSEGSFCFQHGIFPKQFESPHHYSRRLAYNELINETKKYGNTLEFINIYLSILIVLFRKSKNYNMFIY